MLEGLPPEKAATTHPVLLSAVIRYTKVAELLTPSDCWLFSRDSKLNIRLNIRHLPGVNFHLLCTFREGGRRLCKCLGNISADVVIPDNHI